MLKVSKIALIPFLMLLFFSMPSFAQGLPEMRRDPCPDAASAMAQSPDDLSKVQADIDRFTLCVERAQLLKRLNDLAIENEDSLLGVSSSNPGFTLNSGQAFDTLPGFDKEAVLNPDGVDVEPVEEVIVEPEDWLIVGISGTGDDLSAKIRKRDGTLAQVKQGQTLPDGALVTSVTPVSVTISEGGDSREISWFEETQ